MRNIENINARKDPLRALSCAVAAIAAICLSGLPAHSDAAQPGTPQAVASDIDSWMSGTTTTRAERAGSRSQDIEFAPKDELAALEAIHFALTQVGDGATFVWHRKSGRLSGYVRPTSSFRGPAGAICRRLVFSLVHGNRTRTIEGTACRERDGGWVLEG